MMGSAASVHKRPNSITIVRLKRTVSEACLHPSAGKHDTNRKPKKLKSFLKKVFKKKKKELPVKAADEASFEDDEEYEYYYEDEDGNEVIADIPKKSNIRFNENPKQPPTPQPAVITTIGTGNNNKTPEVVKPSNVANITTPSNPISTKLAESDNFEDAENDSSTSFESQQSVPDEISQKEAHFEEAICENNFESYHHHQAIEQVGPSDSLITPSNRKIFYNQPSLSQMFKPAQKVEKFESMEKIENQETFGSFPTPPEQFDSNKQHYLHVELVYTGRRLIANEKSHIEDQITEMVNRILSASPQQSETMIQPQHAGTQHAKMKNTLVGNPWRETKYIPSESTVCSECQTTETSSSAQSEQSIVQEEPIIKRASMKPQLMTEIPLYLLRSESPSESNSFITVCETPSDTATKLRFIKGERQMKEAAMRCATNAIISGKQLLREDILSRAVSPNPTAATVNPREHVNIQLDEYDINSASKSIKVDTKQYPKTTEIPPRAHKSHTHKSHKQHSKRREKKQLLSTNTEENFINTEMDKTSQQPNLATVVKHSSGNIKKPVFVSVKVSDYPSKRSIERREAEKRQQEIDLTEELLSRRSMALESELVKRSIQARAKRIIPEKRQSKTLKTRRKYAKVAKEVEKPPTVGLPKPLPQQQVHDIDKDYYSESSNASEITVIQEESYLEEHEAQKPKRIVLKSRPKTKIPTLKSPSGYKAKSPLVSSNLSRSGGKTRRSTPIRKEVKSPNDTSVTTTTKLHVPTTATATTNNQINPIMCPPNQFFTPYGVYPQMPFFNYFSPPPPVIPQEMSPRGNNYTMSQFTPYAPQRAVNPMYTSPQPYQQQQFNPQATQQEFVNHQQPNSPPQQNYSRISTSPHQPSNNLTSPFSQANSVTSPNSIQRIDLISPQVNSPRVVESGISTPNIFGSNTPMHSQSVTPQTSTCNGMMTPLRQEQNWAPKVIHTPIASSASSVFGQPIIYSRSNQSVNQQQFQSYTSNIQPQISPSKLTLGQQKVPFENVSSAPGTPRKHADNSSQLLLNPTLTTSSKSISVESLMRTPNDKTSFVSPSKSRSGIRNLGSSQKSRKWRQCTRSGITDDPERPWWMPDDWAKERGIGLYGKNNNPFEDTPQVEPDEIKTANVEHIRVGRFIPW